MNYQNSIIEAIAEPGLPLQPTSELVQAWLRATPVERLEFGRWIGPAVIWDEIIVPLIG